MNRLSSLPSEIVAARVAANTEEGQPLPDQPAVADPTKTFDSHLPLQAEAPAREGASPNSPLTEAPKAVVILATESTWPADLRPVGIRPEKREQENNAERDETIVAVHATIMVDLTAPPVAAPLPIVVRELAPVTQTPVTQPPVTQTPATETLATQTPESNLAFASPTLSQDLGRPVLPTDAEPVPNEPAKPSFQPTIQRAIKPGVQPKSLNAALAVAAASDEPSKPGATPSPTEGGPVKTVSTFPVAETAGPNLAKTPESLTKTTESVVPPSPALRPAKSSGTTKPLPVEPGSAEKKPNDFSIEERPAVEWPRAGGTGAAKQQVTMSIAELETKPKNNPFAAAVQSAKIDVPAPRVPAPPQPRDFSSGDPQSDSPSQPAKAEAAIPLSPDTARAIEPPQKTPHAEQVSRVFHAVTDAIERLQTDGHTNVEMQIKLRDGGQLTIKLQIHGGEVRTTFKTDSNEWREAIARGWADFSSDSAERGVRVTNPIFESPAPQSGLNDFNNQRHDRRAQAEFTASDHQSTPFAFKRERKPAASAKTPAPAASPLRKAKAKAAGLSAWA